MKDHHVTSVSESWRARILAPFSISCGGMTLVCDPDSLLVEEEIQRQLRNCGYEVLRYEDPIAFRLAYEAKYRFNAKGHGAKLVVILQDEAPSLRHLPYDLLQDSRTLTFSLGDLFPQLNRSVLAALDSEDYDALLAAHALHPPLSAGEKATKDWVLRHAFGIDIETLHGSEELLGALLRHHSRSKAMPALLRTHLVERLRSSGRFAEWPLETLVPNRAAFLGFLQERWPRFVHRHLGLTTDEHALPAAPAPADLPFDHPGVRAYMDGLFLEGALTPLNISPELRERCREAQAFGPSSWIALGVQSDETVHRRYRLERLLASLETTLPTEAARHSEWLMWARRWGEFGALWHSAPSIAPFGAGHAAAEPLADRLGTLRQTLDATFETWCRSRYSGLHNLPALPPAMVHQIPKFLASVLEKSSGAGTTAKSKVALLVVDGLALDQWVVLRDALARQRALRFHEDATFAWLPSLTSISRQSIFAGRPPLYFADSLSTTAKEPARWTQCWAEKGLTASEVAYAKVEGGVDDLAAVETALAPPKVRVLGMVVNMVDDIMHGMVRGTRGMHEQVKPWAEEGFMARLLDLLFERDFQVFLTADHGNVEAEGCGRPTEGSTASQRGTRVRIFSDAVLRAPVAAKFPGSIEWPSIGVPDDCVPLLAPARRAFVPSGERIVSHGGLSLEELIVPFVGIEKA